jgi:two-component system nitrogen regulation response regulator NtrX
MKSESAQSLTETLYKELRADYKIKTTALIVDDSPRDVLLLETILDRLNFKSCSVYSGYEAVELLAKSPDTFGIIFVDVYMPGMSGLQTIQLLRQINKRLNIVILTGADQVEVLPNSGYCGLMQKPATMESVREILSKTRFIAPGDPSF